jgi:hypothetical protein
MALLLSTIELRRRNGQHDQRPERVVPMGML